MALTRMSSRTRKHALLCVLVLTVLSVFASNSFAADHVSHPIPATKPTSVLLASMSCGYYPTADGRTVNKYFSVAYNGLGFTDMGYTNGELYFHFGKKPASVVSYNGRPFHGDVPKVVNAKAGELIVISGYDMAYEINSLFLTFDEPSVAGGKVYYKLTLDLRTKEIIVATMTANRTQLTRSSTNTWSGPTPHGDVKATLNTITKNSSSSVVKLFGSQGLYLPANPLATDYTLAQSQNKMIGANFWQRGQSVWGSNSGSKSTQRLTYVLADKTGCEAMSYIEIK